jgi:beta-xylosidase
MAFILTITVIAAAPIHAAATYRNPILAGDYPDPSIIHVGRNYYMVNTSEMYTPGLLIWHSRDLVHWEPVTYALQHYDGVVAAPDLTYYRHRFYIYYTPGRSTHVITADKIQGPWSKPIRLKRGGKPFAAFDPFFIAGPHGTPYLIGAGDFIVRLAPDGLSVIGKRKYIYNGWPIPKTWMVECPCLEGPKVFRHGGYYYLVSAEGGTSGPPTSHMAVVARSRNLSGPWINSPYNPLVHTYSRHDEWWSTGHGTVLRAPNKQWYIIFHGYRKNYLTLGRSVLMEPVRWTKNGWLELPPRTTPAGRFPSPGGWVVSKGMRLSDNFSGRNLGMQWQFYGPVPDGRYKQSHHRLVLHATGTDMAASSPMLCMAVARSYSVMVRVHVEPGTEAGLVLFYDPSEFISVGVGLGHVWYGIQGKIRDVGAFTGTRAVVKIINRHNSVECFWGAPGRALHMLLPALYVGGYTHQTFGKYLSLRPGLYAIGTGSAVFKTFQYNIAAQGRRHHP